MLRKIIFTILILIQTLFAKNFERKEQLLFSDERVNYNRPWLELRKDKKEALKKLVELLKKSRTGRIIIKRAERKAALSNKTLFDILEIGEGSLTDTTLIRKFSPSSPDKVSYKTRSKVILNKRLTLLNAILDLAHELTHYSFRKPFNPYRNNFGLKDFISSTVEGRGGEVDAYIIECRVYLELFPKRNDDKSNCYRVIDSESGKLSKLKGIKEFYKVGGYFDHMKNKLKEYRLPASALTGMSESEAQFVSSAYGLPYPVAAVREYEGIMERVCVNDKKRLGLLRSQLSSPERSIASSNGLGKSVPVKNVYQKMAKELEARCGHFISH